MKKTTLLLALLLALQSCGTAINTIGFEKHLTDNVTINSNLTREIGENLIVKGDQYYQEAYKITGSPSFKINGFDYPYKKGDVLPLAAENKAWLLYYNYEEIELMKRSENVSPDNIFGIAKNKNTNEIEPYLINEYGFFHKKQKDFVLEETTYYGIICDNCFKQEFVFNGKANNSLKFMYREYVDDMARPAFYQELQYDLSEGNIVGFKGLRIEVINVSNTNITYKVLNSFN